MTTAGPTERDRWLAAAGDTRYGTCGVCGRDRDQDGHRLYVARKRGGRVWRCFDCSTQPRRRRRP